KFDQASLVGNGQQGAGYAAGGISHGQGPLSGDASAQARGDCSRASRWCSIQSRQSRESGWLAAFGRVHNGTDCASLETQSGNSGSRRALRRALVVAAEAVERTKLQRIEEAWRESCRITIWAVRRGPSLPARNTLSSRSTLSSIASKVQTSRLG